MNQLFVDAVHHRLSWMIEDIPNDLLDVGDEQAFKVYVMDYINRYGVFPPRAVLLREFAWLDGMAVSAETPEASFDRFINSRRTNKLSAYLRKLAHQVSEGTRIDESEWNKALRMNTVRQTTLGLHQIDIKMFERNNSKVIPLAFPTLQRITNGLHTTDMLLMYGRPKQGKTLMLLANTYFWWTSGYNVLFISKEMSQEDVMSRLLAMQGGFDYKLFRKGEWSSAERSLIESAIDTAKLARGRVIVPQLGEINTVSDVISAARNGNYDVVAVDGVYLLMSDQFRTGKEAHHEMVRKVAYELKAATSIIGAPFVIVSQRNRTGGERSGDNAVQLDDIAFSDGLAQACDFAISYAYDTKTGLYRSTVMASRHSEAGDTFGVKVNWSTMGIHEVDAPAIEIALPLDRGVTHAID